VRARNDLGNAAGTGMGRRRALKLFAATGVAGALGPTLAACSTPSSAPPRATQTLRVGLIYPQSGALQEIGFEMSTGFQLFLKQNNNQIAGMNVDVANIDEGTTTSSGVSAVRGALKSGTHDVIVGIAQPEVIGAVPDDVTSARIPLLGTNLVPFSTRASTFLWSTSFVAGEASTALAAYILGIPSGMNQSGEMVRPGSIVVYSDGTPEAQTEAQKFITGIGGSSIALHQVTGAPTSPSVFNQIRSWGPGLVFAATSVVHGPSFTAGYHRAGITAPLCGPGYLTEQSVQAASANKVFTSMNYSPDLNNTANATFTSAYYAQSNGKVPTAYAMTTYDAAAVLDATISGITGEVTPVTINTALSGVQSFDSPRGRWQFNQSRTPLQQWYLRQVRMDGAVLDNRSLADLEALT